MKLERVQDLNKLTDVAGNICHIVEVFLKSKKIKVGNISCAKNLSFSFIKNSNYGKHIFCVVMAIALSREMVKKKDSIFTLFFNRAFENIYKKRDFMDLTKQVKNCEMQPTIRSFSILALLSLVYFDYLYFMHSDIIRRRRNPLRQYIITISEKELYCIKSVTNKIQFLYRIFYKLTTNFYKVFHMFLPEKEKVKYRNFIDFYRIFYKLSPVPDFVNKFLLDYIPTFHITDVIPGNIFSGIIPESLFRTDRMTEREYLFFESCFNSKDKDILRQARQKDSEGLYFFSWPEKYNQRTGYVRFEVNRVFQIKNYYIPEYRNLCNMYSPGQFMMKISEVIDTAISHLSHIPGTELFQTPLQFVINKTWFSDIQWGRLAETFLYAFELLDLIDVFDITLKQKIRLQNNIIYKLKLWIPLSLFFRQKILDDKNFSFTMQKKIEEIITLHGLGTGPESEYGQEKIMEIIEDKLNPFFESLFPRKEVYDA
ncbi:MAG: hypothetical protein JXB88_01665 [Spirochaetales bacterium]|nr:hypothetical protein [Spirochaetales bacterium]